LNFSKVVGNAHVVLISSLNQDAGWPLNDTCPCGAKAIKIDLTGSQAAYTQQNQAAQAARQQQAASQYFRSQYQSIFGPPKSTQQTGNQNMNPKTSNARIWCDQSVSAYRMTIPFNQQFNETFKTLIPASDRNWNPDAKTWTITEKYFDPTKRLIEQLFGGATIISRSASEKASQPPPIKVAPIDNVFLQFIKLLPYEAAQKAYRAAALILHPDKGGDMTKMADLNACWQRLEKEWFNKSQQ